MDLATEQRIDNALAGLGPKRKLAGLAAYGA